MSLTKIIICLPLYSVLALIFINEYKQHKAFKQHQKG